MVSLDFIFQYGSIAWNVTREAFANSFLSPYSPVGLYAFIGVPVLLVLAIKFGYAYDYSGLVPLKYRNTRDLRNLLYWLLPKKLLTSPSLRQDIKVSYFYYLISGPIILLAIPFLGTDNLIEGADAYSLSNVLGSVSAEYFLNIKSSEAPKNFAIDFAYTILLLLAVNLGYWIAHYSQHKISILWQFHKIHHSAEHLTGFTSVRHHFIDLLIFEGTGALFLVCAHLATNATLGYTPMGEDNTIIFYIFYTLLSPIYFFFHSPYWISLGKLEFIFTSPAMHTIHHSKDPRHFNKNFGNDLSIFDTIFGTAYRTDKKPPDNLQLGIDDQTDWNRVSLWKTVYLPFVHSFQSLHMMLNKSSKKNVNVKKAA